MEEMQHINEREIAIRSNGSQVFTEAYSGQAVKRLKDLVKAFYNQGERKYYCILVDGEIVVPKNADVRKFSRYLQFINKNTHQVEVRMYQGTSPNCNKYLFIFNKAAALSGNSSELSVQEQIEKALEKQRIENELVSLKEQLEQTIEERDELIKENEERGTGLEQLTKLLKEVAPLAGAFGLTPKTGLAGTTQEAKPDAEVDIEIESEKKESTPENKENNQILNDLKRAYGEDGTKNALGWVATINDNQELQNVIREELNRQKIEKDGEA